MKVFTGNEYSISTESISNFLLSLIEFKVRDFILSLPSLKNLLSSNSLLLISSNRFLLKSNLFFWTINFKISSFVSLSSISGFFSSKLTILYIIKLSLFSKISKLFPL